MNDRRHTITLNETAYETLREYGRFGESYSELVSRLLNELNAKRGASA